MKFSRLLYFGVTCFFVVLYFNHVFDYFFERGFSSYCATFQVTSLLVFQALFCDTWLLRISRACFVAFPLRFFCCYYYKFLIVVIVNHNDYSH